MIGISVVDPYVPATTEVLAKDKDTFPAVPPPVRPVPGDTDLTAYDVTLAESTRVEVCPVRRLISEADAVTIDPFKNMVLKLALPLTFNLYDEGPVPPRVIFPVFDIYKACKDEEDPVTSIPKDDEVTRVVNLSKDPPRITVPDELVSPLAKESGDWYEIVAYPALFTLPFESIDRIGI